MAEGGTNKATVLEPGGRAVQMTNIVDDLILTAHQAALDELKHMLSRIDWQDMEPCEVVAFVTLLRSVHERVVQKIRDDMAPVEPIPLKLVPERPNRKRPVGAGTAAR